MIKNPLLCFSLLFSFTGAHAEVVSDEAPFPAYPAGDVLTSRMADTGDAYVFDCPASAKFPDETVIKGSKTDRYCNTTSVPARWKYMPNPMHPDDVSVPITDSQRVIQAVAAINKVNDLQGTHVDPRFLVCIASRESGFNPLAGNCKSSAVGMFQVMEPTMKDMFERGPRQGGMPGFTSKIPGMENLDYKKYRALMSRSSLAQTEVAVMTLFNKALASSNEFVARGGQLALTAAESVNGRQAVPGVSVDVYNNLARIYYGDFDPNSPKPETQKQYKASLDYQSAITGCYSCLRDGIMNEDGGILGTFGQLQLSSCLAKAKD